MLIVVRSKVTFSDLDAAASARNVAITDETDRADYLLLLQSADAVIQAIDDEPDYIPPELQPVETLEPRTYFRPEAESNILNAWSHRCKIEAKNPTSELLKGRTIALKDNISVAGLPTTIGTFAQLISEDGQYPISPIDAAVVKRVLEAGATVIGTATCENYSACPLSYSAVTGPVHNPWLKGYNAGGSSSGPGALVAADMSKHSSDEAFGETVDMAIGGDQGGSIRLPASYCGIYGLKPTFGLVPYTGVASIMPMVDHAGPICKSVRDVAVLLQVIAGYDGIDHRMTAESPLRDNVKDYAGLLDSFMKHADSSRPAAGFRIGLLKESLSVAGLSDVVRETVSQAAKACFSAAGAEVKEVSIPMHTLGPAIWTASTRGSMAEFAVSGQMPGYLSYHPPHIKLRWPMDQEMFDLLTATNPAVPNLVLASKHVKSKFGNAPEAKAHRKVFELRAAYDKAFEDFDILVTPCTPAVAMPHPKLKFIHESGSSVMDKLSLSVGSTSNTCPFNVTGHPAISVPCGFAKVEVNGSDSRLPIGMQLVAKRWDEETLLKAAAIFEASQNGLK